MSRRTAPVRWSEVTALFGGTCDPPHLSHRQAIEGLFSHPGVGRVLVLPSPSPAYKPTVARIEDRVAMVKLAFGSSARIPFSGPVEIDLSELERSKRNPDKPTYTFDTLSEARQRIPDPAFVIGTDQLQKLHTWHRFPDVLGLAHWIVLERKGFEGIASSAALSILNQWTASGLGKPEGTGWRVQAALCRAVEGVQDGSFLQIVPTPAPSLSSSQIREHLARYGKPPENALLPEVETYLMTRGNYGTSNS